MDSLSLTECVQKLGVTSSDVIIRFLEDQKQNGFIYYREDLNTISKDTQFDLYFSEAKGFIKNNHAFPIPRDLYDSFKIDHWSFRWLSLFYHLYYQETSPSPFEWQDWDFYIGEQFVWAYKINTIINHSHLN
ncbi:hypothetical protein JDS99_10035 [Bacillus cereus group sp. N6]|uniref:hypothetical protein n=1 Tax=Bacillus cereus group sp. N6 TaxID=2794583 RepID=UPI0018F42883|nr:hypothetical protein [Bacillus cereus group sp. N6]MBJ8109984.1 hypothetical protein [Bacillus cereus group sp. N6]